MRTQALEEALRRIDRRLIPFLLLMYVLAFLDRANIGFAKEAFQHDTGLSDAAYALGAGIFFAGYALLEIPSNLALHRVGARLWLSRIMISWGVISAAMAVASTEPRFLVLRFLLGAAEAGFFPGIIYYLTRWYPPQDRSRALGLFYFGAPLAFILGGPLSGVLLELDGIASLHGWQWMFLTEGLLASAVGVWAARRLDDSPAQAQWLPAHCRTAIQDALNATAPGAPVTPPDHAPRIAAAILHPTVLHLALVYFLIQIGVYGVTFYLPTQVASIVGRKVGLVVSLVTAIPWLAALAAAYAVPRVIRNLQHTAVPAAAILALASLGIAASSLAGTPVVSLAALALAAAGLIGVQPVFWTFPTARLTGISAAAGIALINAFGNTGGFVAPMLRTHASKAWDAPSAGLIALAGATLAGALLLAFIRGPKGAAPAAP